MNKFIEISNANSCENYFTLHNVKTAHKLSLGEGVKVGIIDWLFSLDKHINLYAGYVNISNITDQLQQQGHGHWMARTLREISPKCEIYAINAVDYNNEESRITLLEKAVDWAIDNNIEILTYSHMAFSGKEKVRLYNAIGKANKAGLITTFIHCDSPHNIWPYACYPYKPSANFNRNPDVNILHYDYSVLMTSVYERYCEHTLSGEPLNGDDIPFFSLTSMSPVLAGFIALLKERNKRLNAENAGKYLLNQVINIQSMGKTGMI